MALLPAGRPPDAGPERRSPLRLASDRLRCLPGSLPVRTAWPQTAGDCALATRTLTDRFFLKLTIRELPGGPHGGCSIRYPLCSMQGTGLLGIPAEPLFWFRIYLAASRPGG